MLFHNLHETGKVELGVQGQIVYIGDKRRYFLLHILERLVIRRLTPRLILIIRAIVLIIGTPVQCCGLFLVLRFKLRRRRLITTVSIPLLRIVGLYESMHRLLEGFDPLAELFGFRQLEIFTLFQLPLELVDEFPFIFVVPSFVGIGGFRL